MERIGGIDLLRFVGAVSVVALHLGSKGAFEIAGLSRLHVLFSGVTGVMLFYVISGFLITTRIMAEIQRTGSFSVSDFYIRRVFRIFPLYYLALMAYVAVHLSGIQTFSWRSFAFALAYTYNFVPNSLYDGWLGSFHTLATEEHFYLLYPLVVAGMIKMRAPLWVALLAAIAATPALTALSEPFAGAFKIARWTFNAWSPILIGCLFGYYYATTSKREWHGNNSLLYGFAALFLTQVVHFNVMVTAVAFGMLLLHLAYHQGDRWVRMISTPTCRYLGDISYGIYVWQSFILATGPGRRLIDNPYLAVAVVFCLAALSWRFVERPMLKLRPRAQARSEPGTQLQPVTH